MQGKLRYSLLEEGQRMDFVGKKCNSEARPAREPAKPQRIRRIRGIRNHTHKISSTVTPTRTPSPTTNVRPGRARSLAIRNTCFQHEGSSRPGAFWLPCRRCRRCQYCQCPDCRRRRTRCTPRIDAARRLPVRIGPFGGCLRCCNCCCFFFVRSYFYLW